MFYLGSIAGIFPYLLIFSLTIVWGGQPYFASVSPPETKNEIAKEETISAQNLKSFAIGKQIVAWKIRAFLAPFCSREKVFNDYLVWLFGSAELGISLLRAPPVSLF